MQVAAFVFAITQAVHQTSWSVPWEAGFDLWRRTHWTRQPAHCSGHGGQRGLLIVNELLEPLLGQKRFKLQVIITDIMDNRLEVAKSMGATHTYKVSSMSTAQRMFYH